MVTGVAALAVSMTRSRPATTTPVTPAPATSSPAASSPASTMPVAFLPTVPNTVLPPTSGTAGMVWIPGGEFSMGAQDPGDMNDAVGMQATTDSRPIHRVYVDGF